MLRRRKCDSDALGEIFGGRQCPPNLDYASYVHSKGEEGDPL